MFTLYNTKTRTKEIFSTVNGSKTVRIYSCGPTVYDFAHIGNFSMYIFTDILRRYLEKLGYSVVHIMNITNVGHLRVEDDEDYDLLSNEDKLERAAKKEGLDPWVISEKYTKVFLDDMKKLNILNPEQNNGFMPKATDNIRYMQAIIKKLLENGLAYITPLDNIYFDVSKFSDYGKFSGKNLSDLEAGKGGRIDVEELKKDKKNIFDFSLWITDESHIMKWDFPDVIKNDRKGYPGWHIECSAMSARYLTKTFSGEDDLKLDISKFETIDIHTGGEDHIFPHHEDEIAQTEGCFNKQFAKFWLHRKHILVDGQKMSKSKGNFYTISDLEQGKIGEKFDALDFRMWVLMGHYRSQRDFTLQTLREANTVREKIQDFYMRAKSQELRAKSQEPEIQELIKFFYEAMGDDLNTPKAISIISRLINDFDKNTYIPQNVLNLLDEFNSIFAIIDVENKPEEIPQDIKDMAKERWQARLNKDFEKSDELREKIFELGYEIKDEKDTYSIVKK